MSPKQNFGEKKHTLSVKQKKISFAAAVLLVIGSSIGAGTFLKNKEVLLNTGNSIVLLIISWLLSITAVVCMAISLVEITSGAPNDNGGFVSWNKTFNRKILYKMSKNFVAYIYLPLTFFLMPYYSVMTFQDAFGWQTQWWVAALIGFAFALWFLIMSGLSSKAGNIQNQILSYLKFIPLAFAAVVGFVCIAMGKSNVHLDPVLPTKAGEFLYPSWMPTTWTQQEGRQLVGTMFPLLGMLASVPAILFTYDGFYSAASIQTEMQHPEKTGNALVIGLLTVSIADIVIAVSLCLCSTDGKLGSITFNGLSEDGNNALHIVIAIMEILVALGVLGIINSMALWTPRFYEYLIKDDELWVPDKYKTKLNDHCPKVGTVYAIIISTIFFVAFTAIGVFGYIDVNLYGNTEMITIANNVAGFGYGQDELNSLYSFCDLMGNWTSVFAFAFIVFAMIGGIKNKYQYKVKIPVKEVKGFTPCTIISTVIIGLGLWFLIVSAVANVPLVATWHSQIGDIDPINGEYTNSDWTKQMVGVSVTLGLLFVFFGVTAIPSYVAVKKESTPIRGGGSNEFDIKGLKDKEKVIIYKPKDLKKAKA